MSYRLHRQKTRTGHHRVCLVNVENGKLVLYGEPIERKADAEAIIDNIFGFWNSRHLAGNVVVGPELPPTHKFTPNSGPKKLKTTFAGVKLPKTATVQKKGQVTRHPQKTPSK